MEKIKFSFIIPAYNSSKYIEKCLNSIITQTYKNVEIIVVDDCSTDNTYDIVKKFDTVKLLKTAKNSRQGAARNLGIENSTGDYILFVDSDDFLCDEFILKKIYDKLEKENNPDILYLSLKFTGNKELSIIPDEENIKKSYRLGQTPYINAVTVCWKSSLIKSNNIKFPENIKYEDVYFTFLGIEKAKTFSYLQDMYYIYYNHEDSTTTDNSLNQSLDTIKLIDKLFELFDLIDKENYKYLEERIKQQASRVPIRLNRAIDAKLKNK